MSCNTYLILRPADLDEVSQNGFGVAFKVYILQIDISAYLGFLITPTPLQKNFSHAIL